MRAGLGVAVALSVAGGAVIATLPEDLAPWREPAFDRLVSLMPMPDDSAIMVVDIGAVSDTGAPWQRADTARLLNNIAAARPAVVALDIVLGSDCTVTATNQSLADALARVPTTLGFLLAPRENVPPKPDLTIAASEGLALPLIWQATGAEHACQIFEQAAMGSAVTALAGGMDAIIRDVPALVAVGQNAYLGLALDALRLSAGRRSVLLGGDPAWMRLSSAPLEIGPSAHVRFHPSGPARWAARTLDAPALLALPAAARPLEGKIVFIGSSDPGSGALRATAASPVHPSVQIHADVAATLLGGTLPLRAGNAAALEATGAMVGALLAGAVGAAVAPVLAGLLVLALALVWVTASIGAAVQFGLLFDPVAPGALVLLAGMMAMVTQATQTRRAETAMRRRMAQLLPADVVSRLVRQPDLLRLEGEERQVTALFTDIEGFTQSLQGVEPRAFVAILDAYFAGMTRIVLQHGGMIDKLVGDAVHALFNAPANLDHHVDKAIACAIEMHAFGEAFRQQPDMQALRFGRTRIGIETGMVILGDVGAADKIDYTAHGAAINMAARLEEANKRLGSSICIGPTAGAAANVPLDSLGIIELRSFGPVAVFTPAGMTAGGQRT
ncbi:adenylate/guanylate cyclase domain-containing protein [Devosia aquimaris]|uniref:adenylate/guanylate cyclase domain-containing protein n=1 Tax=Devosia aquimaris TaxID=2866214 RepID=UPI001CD06962|nr:adenylate/guanylate cyclase domain-containing protein [Devosia sp. CJK-A8-3]